jgi:hypothetical protein
LKGERNKIDRQEKERQGLWNGKRDIERGRGGKIFRKGKEGQET